MTNSANHDLANRDLHFEIVVVGAGPAGLAAACAAAESGKRVAIIDDTPWLGGQIWRGQQAKPSVPQAQKWIEKFRRSGATLFDRTSVIGIPANHHLLAERDGAAFQIHFEKLIIATGARELFLPFPGWTLPGVFGLGGLQALVKNGMAVSGKKIALAGTGPLMLAVADGLKKSGAKIVCMTEQAPTARLASFALNLFAHPQKILQGIGIKSRLLGVPYSCGVWPLTANSTADGSQLRSVVFTDGKKRWEVECDLLACGFHLVPNVELPLMAGCRLADGFVAVNDAQETSVPNIFCAGEPTGIGGVDSALVEGQIAGYAASGAAEKAKALFGARASWHRFRAAMTKAFALRKELKTLANDDTLLCRCEDVPFGRVKSCATLREAKLHSRCGMGPCHGRICGSAAKFIFGWSGESVRPPLLPARLTSFIINKNQH